jgi:transcriptional regulator
MLILKTLTRGPAHGYAIARHLERLSADILQVGESSLYPALQRLLVNGWVTAEWGETDLRRRARFYRLTPAGRKRLAAEAAGFEQVFGAIAAIMRA